jgi:CheY-like chemotaxis protein
MSHTLLLADDSVTIQRVIELTFADEDIDVIAVSDGDQAIARLEASPPDIVLADIGMPGRNGYEVARYVKQSPRLSHIPVVLLTGAFEPVDQARADEAGCDGVLAKPFEPQLVIGRVKELLQKARKPAAPAPADHAAPAAPPPAHAEDPPTDPLVVLPPAPAAAAVAPAATAHIDDYFDRLDAAFEKLSNSPPPAPSHTAATPAPAGDGDALDWFTRPGDQGEGRGEPWDLPAPRSSTVEPDLPPSHESPSSAVAAPAVAAPAAAPQPSETPPAPAPVALATTLHDYAPERSRASQSEVPTVLNMPLPAVIAPPPAVETPAPAIAPAAPPGPAAPARPSVSAALPTLSDAFAALLAAEHDEAMPAVIPTWPAPGRATDELVERVAGLVLDRLSEGGSHDRVSEIVAATAERLVREEIDRIKAEIK